MRKKSKTIRIYKRAGLKISIAHNIRKHIKKTKNKFIGILDIKIFKISIMFCFFLKIPSKFKIYKILRKYDIIITNPKSLNFVVTYYEQILQWLNSKEFKEQYINTNHPYPPLLNPRRLKDLKYRTKENQESQNIQPYTNLSYQTISAELAWDLNLPLPRGYKSIWLYNSCSGGEAIQTFFEICNVEFCTIVWRFKDYKNAFLYLYRSYLQGKYIIFSLNNWQNGAKKFASLLDKKVPIFCIARDPISRIKTIVNHLDSPSWNIESKNFTLKSKITFPTMYYRGAFRTRPDINIIGENINFAFPPNELGSITTRLEWLKNATSKVVFISIDEISGKNTFDTFLKLSQDLVFNAPSNSKAFEGRVNRYEGLIMLPCILNANTKDIDEKAEEAKVEIIISTHQLTPNANKNLYNIVPLIGIKMPQDNMILYTKDYKTLSKNTLLLKSVKAYLQKYMQKLERYMADIKANLVSEKDILQYLKNNPNVMFDLKQTLQADMNLIKQMRPDIVESWKHYQEFERMYIMKENENIL